MNSLRQTNHLQPPLNHVAAEEYRQPYRAATPHAPLSKHLVSKALAFFIHKSQDHETRSWTHAWAESRSEESLTLLENANFLGEISPKDLSQLQYYSGFKYLSCDAIAAALECEESAYKALILRALPLPKERIEKLLKRCCPQIESHSLHLKPLTRSVKDFIRDRLAAFYDRLQISPDALAPSYRLELLLIYDGKELKQLCDYIALIALAPTLKTLIDSRWRQALKEALYNCEYGKDAISFIKYIQQEILPKRNRPLSIIFPLRRWDGKAATLMPLLHTYGVSALNTLLSSEPASFTQRLIKNVPMDLRGKIFRSDHLARAAAKEDSQSQEIECKQPKPSASVLEELHGYVDIITGYMKK